MISILTKFRRIISCLVQLQLQKLNTLRELDKIRYLIVFRLLLKKGPLANEINVAFHFRKKLLFSFSN